MSKGGPQQRVFVGDVYPTDNFGNITVIEYNGTNDVLVKFEDGNLKKTSVTAIKRKSVKNNFKPVIYGVGFLGEYEYASVYNLKRSPAYVAWVSMLKRCYDSTNKKSLKNYYGICTVDSKWHNFNTFEKWYNSNCKSNSNYLLDKDLKLFGNKVYCEEYCSLVPIEVNNLLLKREALRGDYPIGVSLHKPTGKFVAQCHSGSPNTYIGLYQTVNEAFLAYKKVKEGYIKKVAEQFKEYIDPVVYNNLINYEVTIDD